jgi:DNA primase large subunit
LTQDQPGTQDSHGCPYRHFSAQALQSLLLSSYGISDPSQVKEILDATKSQHYHVACTRVFEITHAVKYDVKKGDGLGSGESVSHPNRYFERSRELEKLANGDISAPSAAPAGPSKDEGEGDDSMQIDA